MQKNAFVCKWLNYYDEGPDNLGPDNLDHHPVDALMIPLEHFYSQKDIKQLNGTNVHKAF